MRLIPTCTQGYQALEDSHLTAFDSLPNPESTLKVHRDNTALYVDSELRSHPSKDEALFARITDEGWNVKLAVGSYRSVDTKNSRNQGRSFFAN